MQDYISISPVECRHGRPACSGRAAPRCANPATFVTGDQPPHAHTVAALATGIFSLARPALKIETVGDATHYRINPDSVRRSAALLLLAAATALALLRREVDPGRKRIAGMLLTAAVVCLVPVWHQSACHVIVTPDTVTAPLRGGLFPGNPTTIRLDGLADIFFQSERRGSPYQIFRTKTGGRIDLDFGPASAAATQQVEANANAHSVRVHHSF